ncbi:hypothetical protein [Evansella cellulosilytica]|uniref:Uncharacterized protein n=1 Tax=Evansella cellulosilytica (strain ATCC 21833 / DSM 2522 / FERM P-1141 / JCM 9156 / N-4) TaxID=649639 RepID=E6TW95_EVAC2|nr:hypothetical protein [Evansella cellulosilytica]ADU31051.1 hypothetical protein Bcell_2797 [Evansella cellulosilytica DSM 2522]
MIVAIANTIILIGKQNHLYINSFLKVSSFTFVVGIFWEYVTPMYLSNSVTDPWDIVAYMFGGCIYWLTTTILTKKKKELLEALNY